MKFMFHSIEGTGHLNACIGFAQVLKERGHDIVFVINETLTKNVENFGYRVLPLKQAVPENNEGYKLSSNPAEDFAKKMKESGLFSNQSPLQKLVSFRENNKKSNMMAGMMQLMTGFNTQIEKYLQQEQPDAWIHDQFIVFPAVYKANIPWILICSAAPLQYYNSQQLPPFGSGNF